jgi:Tol biopolymer transport system component
MSEYPDLGETGVPESPEPVEQETPESETPGPKPVEPWLAASEPVAEPETVAPWSAVSEPVAKPELAVPDVPKRRVSKKTVWTIIGIVLGLLVACVVAVVLVARPYVIGTKAAPLPSFLAGERILVAFASRGGDDLYLLRLEEEKSEGLLLAEDVTEAMVAVLSVQDNQVVDVIGSPYGGFVPDRDWLVLWHTIEQVSMFGQMNSRSEELVDVLDSKGDWLYGYVFPKKNALFLVESREGRSRCYVAQPNGAAQRVARADACTISMDASTLFLEEVYSDETMLSAMSVKGGRETILLDDVVGVESYQVTADGSQVAYVHAIEGNQQLLVVNRRSGEQTPVSDEVHEVLAYGYAPGGDTLYYVIRENAEDVEVQLYLSTGDRSIAEGATIEVSFTPDGAYVVYLVAGDQGGTLYVDPVGEGDKVVVLSEEGIAGFDLLRTKPPKIVVPVVKEGSVVVYTADLDGSNVVQALDAGAVELETIQYVRDEPSLYVLAKVAAGGRVLYVAPVDGSEPVRLLDGWAEISLLNRSPGGDQLAFQGWQSAGDVLILYAIATEAGAEPVELADEYQGYESAVFTANGQSVVYTARIGDERDAVDVGLVSADGEKKPQVLYEKAFLVDVRWDDLYPFLTPFSGEQ